MCGRLAFVDGFVTNAPDRTDEMCENANIHNESGAWQMIFKQKAVLLSSSVLHAMANA